MIGKKISVLHLIWERENIKWYYVSVSGEGVSGARYVDIWQIFER